MYNMIPFNTRKLARSFFNDDLFRPFMQMSDWMGMNGFRVDIREQDGAYVLDAELPGVPEDAISLTVEDGVMTVSADYRSESRDEKTCYSERRTGHVQRSFSLENIDEEHISAEYKDGILRVTMPKAKPEDNSGKRLIPINGRLTGGTEAPAEKNGDA